MKLKMHDLKEINSIGWFIGFFIFLAILSVGLLAVPPSLASQGAELAPLDMPLFTDITASSGVTATVVSWGASWGDYNSDAFPDLLTYSHEKRVPALFHNNSDGTFTDIITSTPLTVTTNRNFAAWGDYDNDGDQDLAIAVGGLEGTSEHPMELYRNDGGSLVNVAAEAGVGVDLARGRSVSWADYDRDGDLDLFAANHIREGAPNRLWRNNGDGTFTDVALEAGVADTISLNFGSFVDYEPDGWPDIFVMGTSRLILYHNNGDGTFTDISMTAGFADVIGDSYAWGDYDGDGDVDLFIGSAGNASADRVEWQLGKALFSGTASHDQDGFDLEVGGNQLTFNLELKGPDACTSPTCIHIGADGHSPSTNPFSVGVDAYGTPSYTPGVSSGYYIWRDAGTDLWYVRMSSPDLFKYGGVITATLPITSLVPVEMESESPSLGGTRLWRNEGNGIFTETSTQAGLDLPGNYRSANWVDFDNDGWSDLFVVDKGNMVIGNSPDRLFHNNGDGTFADVAAQVGVTGTLVGGGNVSAWADYDLDGFLDLFVQNGGFGGLWPFDTGPNQFFHNEGNANHWLDLQLVGRVSNRSGLGAVVHVTVGGRTQIMVFSDFVSAYNQNGNSLHFGLGESTQVERIIVNWPSGINQFLTNILSDQHLVIYEPSTYMTLIPLIVK